MCCGDGDMIDAWQTVVVMVATSLHAVYCLVSYFAGHGFKDSFVVQRYENIPKRNTFSEKYLEMLSEFGNFAGKNYYVNF